MFSKLLNACLQDVGFCHIIIHKIIFMHCLKRFPQNLSPRKLNRARGNPKREEFWTLNNYIHFGYPYYTPSLSSINNEIYYWMKSVRIRSFSGPHFPAFGLNTERYGVSLSLFIPNEGKYGPEKLQIQTLFMHCILIEYLFKAAIVHKCILKILFLNVSPPLWVTSNGLKWNPVGYKTSINVNL